MSFKLGGYLDNNILYTNHNAGFFSCCSVKLDNIIQYYNKYKKLPIVDSSKQYEWYKNKDDLAKSPLVESRSKPSPLLRLPRKRV